MHWEIDVHCVGSPGLPPGRLGQELCLGVHEGSPNTIKVQRNHSTSEGDGFLNMSSSQLSACKFLPSREHLGHQTGWTHTQPAALGAGFLHHSTETGLFFGEEKVTHLKTGRVGSGRPDPFLSLGCFPWRPHRRAEIITSQCQKQQSSPVPGGNPGEMSSCGHGGAAGAREAAVTDLNS